MQIKGADDRTRDIAALESLLARPDITSPKRSEIDRELRNIRAGIAGEQQAAYEIELYFGRSRNFMTIHDLRFEVGGYAAQIDHLVLDRLGVIWVCESKSFAEGVAVNSEGEWSRFWHGRRDGMPSPVDQNKRHILLLGRLFDDGLVPLPKRFGLARMRPDLRNLVLVSNNARIERPRRKVEGLDHVIKVEKLEAKVRGDLEERSVVSLARAMGQDGLETFARNLAAIHQPPHTNWSARFGLDSLPQSDAHIEPVPASPRLVPRPSGHHCVTCGEDVSWSVAKFCFNNPTRFGGKVYCFRHQAEVGL